MKNYPRYDNIPFLYDDILIGTTASKFVTNSILLTAGSITHWLIEGIVEAV